LACGAHRYDILCQSGKPSVRRQSALVIDEK
jgi:hypothetical protein